MPNVQNGLLERRYTIALQYLSQGVCIFNGDQRVVLSNDRYAEMYGLDPKQISPGMSLRDVIELRIANGVYGERGPEAYARERMRRVTRRTTRIQDLNDGRSILIVQQPTTDGNWVTTHEDITERLHTEEKVAFMALHDPLTGLANRTALVTRLETALSQLTDGQMLCLLLLDLDRFKPVNDTYGHDIGDEVLKIAAKRIRRNVRDTDTVARIGGDEFVIVQSPVSTMAGAEILARRVVDALRIPILTSAGEITIGATMGVTMTQCGSDQKSIPELLKHADTALYQAKASGRGTFQIFTPSNSIQPEHHEQLQTMMVSNPGN